MADLSRSLAAMDDSALEVALRDLAPAIAYPSAVSGAVDVASAVRQRLVAEPTSSRSGPLAWLRARPVRRSLLVAVAALLILAAIAGAVGLGLPGIRIDFGGGATPQATPTQSASPSSTPTPSGPLGQAMGLGTNVSLEEAARIAGLELILPPDAAIGPPEEAYVFVNRAALVWPERPGLPADPATGVGLLLSEFRGTVDEGYYQKTLESETQVVPVTVNGDRGYWIGGPPHFFYYVDPTGRAVDDTHRSVGNTLIWSDGDVTYRLESQLGMDEAIRLAESLR